MNATDLTLYVRDLTGVFTDDVVSDTLILRWLNESYKEIARLEQWSWLPVVDLVTSPAATSPAFVADFHQVLAYRAAIRVLNFVGDDTTRAQFFTQEASTLIEDMRRVYFPALATGAAGTRGDLRRLVRDLINVYDTSIADAMINTALNDTYIELANYRDWDWLEQNIDVAMPAFTSGKHTITLAGGTRRVLSAYVVEANGDVREMTQVPSLADVEDWKSDIYYDVTAAGVMTFAPEQNSEATVRVRYTGSLVSLGNDSATPLFAAEFRSILAYRAAVKLLGIIGDPQGRATGLMEEYSALLASMLVVYELSSDYRTIQMGGDGQLTRKYYPWFKPA